MENKPRSPGRCSKRCLDESWTSKRTQKSKLREIHGPVRIRRRRRRKLKYCLLLSFIIHTFCFIQETTEMRFILKQYLGFCRLIDVNRKRGMLVPRARSFHPHWALSRLVNMQSVVDLDITLVEYCHYARTSAVTGLANRHSQLYRIFCKWCNRSIVYLY